MIQQTNKTILWKEINPEKPNLFRFINPNSSQVGLTDSEIEEITQNLSVNSFDEFVQRFLPTLYLTCDYEKKSFYASFCKEETQNIQDLQSIEYDLLQKNSLLNLFLQIFSQKGTEGFSMSSLDDLAKYLVGDENHQSLLQIRWEFTNKLFVNKKEERDELFERAIASGKNSIQLLYLFVQEARQYLDDDKVKVDIKPVVLSGTSEMQVQVLSISEYFLQKDAMLSLEGAMFYRDCLREYIEESTVPYKKLLFYFLLLPYINMLDMEEELETEYKAALAFYEKIIRVLWHEYKPLLETALGVCTFFKQYGACQGKMAPTLLVANCNAEAIVQKQNQEKLKLYLETVNNKNYFQETIWYSILPNLAIQKSLHPEPKRLRFQSSQEYFMEQGMELDIAQQMIEILSEYQIQTFVSAQSGEISSFQGILKYGLSEMNQIFAALKSEKVADYVVPCYPNFTVLPKEMEWMYIGSGGSGLIVEASYVAAGFYAACQDPVYLQQFYRDKVVTDVPGVAYGTLEEGNRGKIPTAMASECFYFPENFAWDIQMASCGVFFAPYKNKIILHTDRTLSYLHGKKYTVSNVQTLTYIQREIRKYTQDYKAQLLQQFFVYNPKSLLERWKQKENCVNAIIKEKEALSYSLEPDNATCFLNMAFLQEERQQKVPLNK